MTGGRAYFEHAVKHGWGLGRHFFEGNNPRDCYRLCHLTAIWRGNLAHSCLLNASTTCVGGLAGSSTPGFWNIQLHMPQPHAAKVLSSSQISSLAMVRHF